jgi:ParB family chromosome partitioning protein
VELIYGARRLFAARHINIPLRVELREVSDQEAIVAMDIENRQRLDLSAYERGISYAQWLREGYFHSQDDISKTLRISASRVSRLLKVARLPSVIVNAFETPVDIREEWALELVDALEDPQRRAATVQRARAITSMRSRPAPREIYQQLRASVHRRAARPTHLDEVVKDRNGTPLFRIRRQTSTVAVLFPIESVSEETLSEIRGLLKEVFATDSDPRGKNSCESRVRTNLNEASMA